MKIVPDKKLQEIKLYTPTIFKDQRGEIWTKWEKKIFKNLKFNLSKYTTSKKNVLRGFHGDPKSWKLVSCIKGEVLNVIVDYRKSSKNYLKFTSFVLSDNNKISALIPPMFLNSWLCLSKDCIYSYDYSFKGNYNDVKNQISVKWNDTDINFNWPIKNPILSFRDRQRWKFYIQNFSNNMKKKIALIFGITGQDGSYLAEYLLNKNYFVYGVKRQTSLIHTTRIDHIYEDRHTKPNLILRYGDVTDFSNVFKIISDTRPDEIYNLAAQSNVGISFELAEYTAQTDSIGTLRILEAMRIIDKKKKIKFYQASTSEIFGNSPDKPYNEKSRFAPVSPYGTAKLYSYWITKNYREAYSMFTANGILFNHESPRRGENFISRKTIIGLIKILRGKQKTLFLGNLYSKRDWGHAKEFVKAQWQILQQKKADDFVIATGKNYSVKDLVNLVLKKLKIKYAWKKDKSGLEYAVSLSDVGHIKKSQIIVKQDKSYFRPNEVHDLVGDFSKAKRVLKWKPKINFDSLIKEMIESEMKNY